MGDNDVPTYTRRQIAYSEDGRVIVVSAVGIFAVLITSLSTFPAERRRTLATGIGLRCEKRNQRSKRIWRKKRDFTRREVELFVQKRTTRDIQLEEKDSHLARTGEL